MGYYKFGPQCQAKILGEIMEKYLGQKSDGVFVDIGAFDGMTWSNTYGLAHMGWRGLLIEPQAGMLALARQRLAGCNVEFEQLAAGDYNGDGVLFLGGSLSTLSQHQRQVYLTMSWSRCTGLAENKTVRVQVRTLENILEKYNWPNRYDLLSLDVEGFEHRVLAAANLSLFKPSIAVVETHAKYENVELSAKAAIIDAIMFGEDYIKVHEDVINTIYVVDNIEQRRRTGE